MNAQLGIPPQRPLQAARNALAIVVAAEEVLRQRLQSAIRDLESVVMVPTAEMALDLFSQLRQALGRVLQFNRRTTVPM